MSNRIGIMIAHSRDIKEIYVLLLAKQTGMMFYPIVRSTALKKAFDKVKDELK